MTEPMRFRREGERVYVMDGFKPSCEISGHLLRCADLDSNVLRRKFRTITFSCTNGEQDYRMLAYDRDADVFFCRAIPL